MKPIILASGHIAATTAERWLPPLVGVVEPVAELLEPEEPPPPTAEEIAAMIEAAQREAAEAGYRDGYERGYAEGQAQAAAEAAVEQAERAAREQAWRESEAQTLRETVAALESIAQSLADPLADSADALEPELLVLVSAMARRVVMAELTHAPERIQQLLHVALQQLPSRKHPIRLHVNPQDQSWLMAYAAARDEQLTWVADPEIERGGCVLMSGPSRIDATLDARLRQSIDAIWGELHPPKPLAVQDAVSAPPLEVQPDVQPESQPDVQAEAQPPTPAAPPLAQAESEPSEPSDIDRLLDDAPFDDTDFVFEPRTSAAS